MAGFRAQGLQQGDVVCVHSFNNVRINESLLTGIRDPTLLATEKDVFGRLSDRLDRYIIQLS